MRARFVVFVLTREGSELWAVYAARPPIGLLYSSCPVPDGPLTARPFPDDKTQKSDS